MSINTSHDETEPAGRDRNLIEQARRQAEQVGKQGSTSLRTERIGPYKILDMLGEGGMGVIYLAEQTEPLRRRVALKLIKLGMDTKQVIARFESERQALAMMNHPNVAAVLDAGCTETGRPYFVMEHVAGTPITDYCDRHRVDTAERLKLFMQVCDAVQHAHQKGIIHRDIKPSNVLVTVQEGKPVPKVIDFGVAKATEHRLAERTVFTEQGQLIGTPEYMSPEQAEMSALDIDTRTDIYSLGVLLYELLVGALPFESKSLRSKAFGEIQRIIREQEPPKPSTRLSSLGDASATVAQKRRTDRTSLERQVRGDLDWITMKAMEKDRGRRYTSASDFSADIRRHLKHEPVWAGPPSAAYRVKKFVRRNRAAAGGATAVLVVLIAGIAVSARLAFRAAAAERLAERRLVESQQEAAKARAVVDFLGTMLTSADPEIEGRDVLVVEVLDKAARDLGEGVVDQPEVEAAVRTAIGATYLKLARLDEAERQLRTAVKIRTRVLGEGHLDVAESLYHLAWLLKERRDFVAAESMYRRCLAIRRGKLGNENVRVADTMHGLGVVLQEMGRLEQAEPLLREALELTRRLKGRSDPELATTMTVLGDLLKKRGEYDQAETLHRQALSIYRAAHGNEHVQVARALSNLASLARQAGRLDEAEPLAREALRIRRARYGGEHPAVASSLVGLAGILSKRGDYEGAEPLLQEALSTYRKTHGESHSYVAGTLLMLAAVHDDKGDSASAAAEFLSVIDMYVGAEGPNHWLVANARSRYGVCLMRLERYSEAESELLGAYEVLSAGGFVVRARTTSSRLSDLYEAWGRDEEAARWRSQASAHEPAGEE